MREKFEDTHAKALENDFMPFVLIDGTFNGKSIPIILIERILKLELNKQFNLLEGGLEA